MNLVTLMKDSVRTCWRNRSLWLFGFFVAASGGGAGTGTSRGGGGGQGLPAWLWPVLVAALVAGLLAFVMHVISEGALIASVKAANDGGAPTVGTGLRVGLRHFGVVFRLKLLAVGAVALGVALAGLPLGLGFLSVLPLPAGVALTALLALGLVPVAVTGFLLLELALRVAVLEGGGAWQAVREARRALSGRLLESLQVAVVAAVGQTGVALVSVVALVPAVLLGLVVFFATDSMVAGAVSGGVLAAPVMAAALGFGGAVRSAVWTNGFLATRALERS